MTIDHNKDFTLKCVYVRSSIRCAQCADDVIQETAIAALERFEKYGSSRPFIGWVLRYGKGASAKKAAEPYGVTPNAISRLLYKTRLVLKKCVENGLLRQDWVQIRESSWVANS